GFSTARFRCRPPLVDASGDGGVSPGPQPPRARRERRLGHQIAAPMSYETAGTSSDRTMIVSISTPAATMNAIWTRNRIGRTFSAEKVAASTTPAPVMTPPVTERPMRMPGRVPRRNDSSRTGHQEDRVVDAEGDQEDERDER